ncbi:hypothetical protein GCM10018952_24220 [Streptosporangium vulgare]
MPTCDANHNDTHAELYWCSIAAAAAPARQRSERGGLFGFRTLTPPAEVTVSLLSLDVVEAVRSCARLAGVGRRASQTRMWSSSALCAGPEPRYGGSGREVVGSTLGGRAG